MSINQMLRAITSWMGVPIYPGCYFYAFGKHPIIYVA